MCIDINIPIIDKDHIFQANTSARSMEFAINLESEIVFIPRAHSFNVKENDLGFSWSGKYAFAHLNMLRDTLTQHYTGSSKFNDTYNYICDGMNEHGLSIGGLYLPGFSRYPDPDQLTEACKSKAISNLYFGSWVLSNFDSVENVIQALKNEEVIVYNPIIEPINIAADFHFVIHDQQGNSVVLEWTTDALYPQMYTRHLQHENRQSPQKPIDQHQYIGVMTNAPTYDWHINNIANYTHMTNRPFDDHVIPINRLTQSLNGSGLTGLPADSLPSSRFIQTYVVYHLATQPSTIPQALTLGQKLLNRVDIPLGLLQQEDKSSIGSDITQWAVLRDHEHAKYYFRSYSDLSLRVVDITAMAHKYHTVMISKACQFDQAAKAIAMELSPIQ
ncbi:linear amide C-N hydrolase [Celerinatantimonas sp. YJH-8]|uniref:linear amide C-N hydrolase n=1 Tax=Celerinatantimonas sp. YJH-8 TaxID=3228714 RepID=UPI0038C1D81D